MGATSKVEASAATGVATAAGRVAAGSRFTSWDRVEPAFGVPSVGVSGGWRSYHDDRGGQGGFFGQYPQQRDDGDAQFTPLVARLAAAYPATESSPENLPGLPLFLTDLLRGVGIYEFNMKVTSGTLTNQGSVINRYS